MKSSDYTKQPKVTLVTQTENPLEAISLGIDMWHMPVGEIDPFKLSENEMVEKFRWLTKQPHQTPFEYVSFVFLIENVSRAWQQQMTRHRVGFSYSIQSLRVIDVSDFADDGRYHMPESVNVKGYYHNSMVTIQNKYNEMLDENRGRDSTINPESTEDARGVLPLNIHSPVSFSCSYRALVGLLRQRLCIAAQGEWKLVVEGIRSEIDRTHHPVFLEHLDCMCKRFKRGQATSHCKTLHKCVNEEGFVEGSREEK